MNKHDRPNPRERLRRIRAYFKAHPKARAAAYLTATVAMLAMLAAGGALHNPFASSGQPSPPAAGSPAGQHKAADASKAKSRMDVAQDPDWPTLPARTARERLAAMDSLLAQPAGVNGARISDYVKPQSADMDGDYTRRQDAFTDLAKAALAGKPSSPDQAADQATAITDAYQAWEDALWRAANDTLHGQLGQMDESYLPIRSWIKDHPGYPRSCRSWASTVTDDGSKAQGRAGFDAQVRRVAAFDQGQRSCAAAMSTDQASRLPQKGSDPIGDSR